MKKSQTPKPKNTGKEIKTTNRKKKEETKHKTVNVSDNYTYILQCRDNTYYTGWTNDIEKRVKAHQLGKGGHYTHARRPVKLVHLETFATKQEAMSREWAIKHLTRKEKEKLVFDDKTPKTSQFMEEINANLPAITLTQDQT